MHISIETRTPPIPRSHLPLQLEINGLRLNGLISWVLENLASFWHLYFNFFFEGHLNPFPFTNCQQNADSCPQPGTYLSLISCFLYRWGQIYLWIIPLSSPSMLGCTWCLQRKVLFGRDQDSISSTYFYFETLLTPRSPRSIWPTFGQALPLKRSHCSSVHPQLWVVDCYSSPGDRSPTKSMANVEEIVKQEEARLHNLHPTTNDVPGCMKLFDDFLLCHGKFIRFDSDYSI